MKLQEAPNAICKVVKFPGSVTSYLRSEGVTNERYGLKGGLLKDTRYAWLSWGPNFEVVRTTNGAKVAAWTFGAALHDSKTRVTCVTELPCTDGSGRVSQFVVGLECELVGGMICVFDIRGSKVLRAVQMPSKVTSVSVVDCGSEGCYPLPQLLSSMTGVLAVGLAGGQIMLVDLCRMNCDDGLNMGACGELRDELHACQLLPISINETDQETLEYKRAHAARTGDHQCVVLNESFLADKMFLLPLPDGNMFNVPRRRVDVTAVTYIPRIASIVAGFSFGSFQIWNLMQLTLEFMSPTMQDPLPLISFGFQEPCDDPRNFCYLWAVHSSANQRNRLPFAVMYALCYQSKEWVDGYGYLYQDFVSGVHRFDFDVDGDEGGITVVGGRSVACHTINKLPSAVTRRDNPRVELDESVQECDLTLCLFVWETWGANCPSKTCMALFDLNQWYKEQMPGKIVKGQASTYIAVFSLDEVVETSANSANSINPLLDVKVDPASLSQFTAVQSLEEHFYPSALAFESLSLLGEELVVMSHPGVQRDILLQLELSGPSALMYPTKLFHHCIAIGLKPVYMEVSSTFNCPLTEQREFLLSVALEYQLLGFLSRCAAEWVDGSQSAMGCTLPALLKWGWQRATSLKAHADNLCIPLYDYSGVKLDSNLYQLLDYCGNQLHHLTTLFQGLLKMCKNPTVQGVGDVTQQAQVLELVAVYIEVVEWFVNVGLLPEFPCGDLALVDGFETAGELGPHRVPYPAAALAKIYQKRRAELQKLSRSATDKMDILFIDGLVKRECDGDRLSSLWERDGGTGLYPPPSVQSLLRTYLLDGIPLHVKHCIVIYVFLDLAGLLESRRYTATINQFIKFPSAFRLTPSFIKITQALWLLDHQDFTEAIDMLLDPLVSMDDLKPWQHQCIIQAFLYQGQHQMALKYIRVQQPPLKDIEDIRLNLTVLLVNGLIHEAFQYQRQHCNEQNSRDLLQHFFSACQQMNQLSVVLQLALSPVEEEAFTQFLQNCHSSQADDMHVMYYLERSRIAEAMEVNNSIRSSKSHMDSNSLKQGHTEDKSSCVRDTIVQAYANTLPSVTRKLALYCAQEKSCLTNWKQVSRPTPMSVDVHRGELQPVCYRSSLIQATLEKARETWSHVIQPPAPPCTPAKRDRSSMEKPSVEMTPFLCTPRAVSETFSFTRDVPAVVFPTLTHPSPKSDDETMDGSPVKRLRYSDHYPSPLGSAIASSRKRLDRYSNVDALSLLQTPHVRRRTLLSVSRLQEQQDLPASPTAVFTPQSILKVRKMVRCSVSPDNLSQVSVPSFTGTSTTPELMEEEEEEEEVAEEKMQDEEVLGRQIRFSLPSDEKHEKTPEDILLLPAIRSASKKSILGVTPRKALSRTRRHGSVRFDSSVPDKKGGSSETLQMTGNKIGISDMHLTSVVSTLHTHVMKDHKSEALHPADSSLGTYQSSEEIRETSQIKDQDTQDTLKSEVILLDNESTNMENDSDVFHSLENSAHSYNNSVVDFEVVCNESPLKKQQIGRPDKESEEVTSTHVDSSEVKEQVISQPTTWKTECSLQNCINVQEARAADAVEARHIVEEEENNLDAVVQKIHEKNGKSVGTAEVDVGVTEESVTVSVAESECKNESQSNTEEVLEEEKKDVAILLDTTTYAGSSFEISKDMEQEEEEEAVTDGVTFSLSDGDGVFGVNTGSDIGPCNILESEAKKMPTLVIESVIGSVEGFASSEELKEYQTLQPVIVESENVLEAIEESVNEIDDAVYVSDEVPDLATQDKEHEATTDSFKEESEPEEDDFMRPKLLAAEIDDEVDFEEEEVIECEEENEEEETENEDLEAEEDDLAEEKEFEPEVLHHPPSDDEESIVILDSDTEDERIEPSKASAVGGKHKAGDFTITNSSDEEGFMEEEEEEDDYETSSKFDSDEEESEDSEETSSEFDSDEGKEEDNEETMSKFDSGSEMEHVLDADAVTTVEPKVNVEVSTSDDDDVIEKGGCYKNPTEVLAISIDDVLKGNEPLVKDTVEKEPMDFETCITANEISKYGQRQVSEVMDIDFPCKEDSDGSKILLIGDHMMDFEVELTATQISKPKQTEDKIDCNTQISVVNQVKLSEMKEENITVSETSEMPVRNGRGGGEECDLELVEKKEKIDMEKLTQRSGDVITHLLHTKDIPKSLQEDGVNVMDIPIKENDALPKMTVVSIASNVTVQQVSEELNMIRCEIKARKSSESSSPSVEKLQPSIDQEERSHGVKPQKTSSRAIEEVDYIKVNAETQMDSLDIRVSEQTDREDSMQRDIEVIDDESYGMKAHESNSIADAGQQEDILSDETKSHGRKVSKPISRACSVQRKDAPSNEIETCERKVHKTSSKVSSVQREDAPVDEIENCETKVRKPSSRASSVQREDVPSDGTESGERKVCKPSSRASSVQREDVSSDGTESGERRVRRASSVQREDVPSDGTESGERRVRRASSVQREDVPSDGTESGERRVRRPSSRSVSGQCEFVPIGGTDDNETKVCKSSSSGCSDHQHVVPSSETESFERRLSIPKRREGSVQRDHLEAIQEEGSYNHEADKIGSGINSVQNAYIPSEEADCIKCKIDDCKKSGSIKCNDVIEADFLDKPSSRASSADYRDVTSANDFEFNENRQPRASSVNSDASTVIWEESPHLERCRKRCGTRSRHSSASSRSSFVQGDEAMDVEGVKTYSTRSHKGSIFLDILYEGPEDIDRTPVSVTNKADMLIQTDGEKRKLEGSCRAVSGFLLEDQGISGPSLPTNEMFGFTSNVTGQLCRKARSESGYVVEPVTRSKRFTRSAIGISNKTMTTDVGSVTDNASTRMSLRSDTGQDRMQNSPGILGSVHGDGSCSGRSSGSSVKGKEQADYTSRGDSLSTQQIIEEYATNRRLTRHQRSMLERSIELAKPSLSQLTRHRKLPSLPETSGDDEDKSEEEDESSSRISSVGTCVSHPRSCPTLHGNTSPALQASTIQLPSSEIPLHKAGLQRRYSRKILSKHDIDSPSSVLSDASTPYASSATSAPSQLDASPLSTRSEDVTLERMRRKSFMRAQIALKSASEHGSVSGVPSGRKSVANSPGDSGSSVSSNAGSSHTSLPSTGSHITRAVATRLGRVYTSEEVRRSPRLARLQDEDLHTASPSTSFHFSPPTLVRGSVKKEESSSGTPPTPVPAFVFSPPQKQQLLPKPHRQSAPSQQTRAHTMALRGLHTITEESTPPSTPTNTIPPQTSERDTTPIAVRKSKKFKPTPSSKTPKRSSRSHLMTPLTKQEQQELAERVRSSRQSVSTEPERHYTVFKHRKLFKIRRSSRSDL
ncbi:Protein ELYS [Zootermopsis nevadensis]|uniref:Protein ELYS n=1 Tax=Zootermopsis nevadensis TaxID=136037 RepID=A0A067QV33_ZOONE|nr:Protein ELYS [Zootermopsis nevadensis]